MYIVNTVSTWYYQVLPLSSFPKKKIRFHLHIHFLGYYKLRHFRFLCCSCPNLFLALIGSPFFFFGFSIVIFLFIILLILPFLYLSIRLLTFRLGLTRTPCLDLLQIVLCHNRFYNFTTTFYSHITCCDPFKLIYINSELLKIFFSTDRAQGSSRKVIFLLTVKTIWLRSYFFLKSIFSHDITIADHGCDLNASITYRRNVISRYPLATIVFKIQESCLSQIYN